MITSKYFDEFLDDHKENIPSSDVDFSEWPCLQIEHFMDESVSSSVVDEPVSSPVDGETDNMQQDDTYTILLQHLSTLIPDCFLHSPKDEFATVKGATEYIRYLRRTLQYSDSLITCSLDDGCHDEGYEILHVPQCQLDHISYVNQDASEGLQNIQYPRQSDSLISMKEFPNCVEKCSRADALYNVTSATPTAFPVALCQTDTCFSLSFSPFVNLSNLDQYLKRNETQYVENKDANKNPKTKGKRRKNSYTVVNDHTFTDIVPTDREEIRSSQGQKPCLYSSFARKTARERKGRDILPDDVGEAQYSKNCEAFPVSSDNHKEDTNANEFTKLKEICKDPVDWTAVMSNDRASFDLYKSPRDYPVLSSLLDESGSEDSTPANFMCRVTSESDSSAPYAYVDSLTSMEDLDEWCLPDDLEDDVFLTSSQNPFPEPDSTTGHEKKAARERKGKTMKGSGLRRPKNGFIRFSIEYRKHLAKQHPKLDNREVSKMLGAKWRRMTHEEKIPYETEFRNDIKELRSKHPDWKYAPLKQLDIEQIEPMPSRLRPREKLKKKFLPTIIKYGPSITTKRQSRVSRRKKERKSPFSYNSFAWFQCKLCSKWRYVPCIDDINLAFYQSMWFCHMNPDPTCNSCFAEGGFPIVDNVVTSSASTPCENVPYTSTPSSGLNLGIGFQHM